MKNILIFSTIAILINFNPSYANNSKKETTLRLNDYSDICIAYPKPASMQCIKKINQKSKQTIRT